MESSLISLTFTETGHLFALIVEKIKRLKSDMWILLHPNELLQYHVELYVRWHGLLWIAVWQALPKSFPTHWQSE